MVSNIFFGAEIPVSAFQRARGFSDEGLVPYQYDIYYEHRLELMGGGISK